MPLTVCDVANDQTHKDHDFADRAREDIGAAFGCIGTILTECLLQAGYKPSKMASFTAPAIRLRAFQKQRDRHRFIQQKKQLAYEARVRRNMMEQQAKREIAEEMLKLDDEKARQALNQPNTIDLVKVYTSAQEETKQRLLKPKPK